MKMSGLILLILLSMPITAQATDYWISPTGSDANACTAIDSAESDPPISPGVYKLTIASGMSCMASGDRLIFRAGTYANQQIQNPVSGSVGNFTTFMADPSGARPVLAPNGAANQIGLYIIANSLTGYTGSYIRIQGLEVSAPFQCLKTTYNVSGVPFYSDHLEWIDMICHDTYSSPVGIEASTVAGQGQNHLVIRNSEFYNSGKNAPDILTRASGYNTIYALGNNAIVEGNSIHDAQHGIAIWGQTGSPATDTIQSNNIIRNNRIYRMGRPDLNPWLDGVYKGGTCIHQSVPGTGNLIYNNLCYDSGVPTYTQFHGIWVGFHTTSNANTKVYNNTLYNISTGAFCSLCNDVSFNQTPLVEFKNNIAYLTAAFNTSGGAVFSNNTTVNPSFVSPTTGDFHLQIGSVARGNGLNFSSVFTTDFDGYTRPASGAWDTGAFMYGGSVPDTTPPAAPTNLTVE